MKEEKLLTIKDLDEISRILSDNNSTIGKKYDRCSFYCNNKLMEVALYDTKFVITSPSGFLNAIPGTVIKRLYLAYNSNEESEYRIDYDISYRGIEISFAKK